MAKRTAGGADLHVISHDKRMRYDPLGYRGVADDIWTQFGTFGSGSFGATTEYENLSFCDLLKDDAFAPLSAETSEQITVTPVSSISASLTVSPSSFDSRRPFSSVENLFIKQEQSPQSIQHHFPISPPNQHAQPPLMPLTPPPSVSSSSSTPSSLVVPRTPPNQYFAMNPNMNHQLPCPVTRPQPQQHHQQPQPQQSQHHMGRMAPPPQMHHQMAQRAPQGAGTSYDPILFKIVRQKATGTNTGVFFYFKIYDKVYRGRRDSFSKDKSIMYLRCNTCPRSVNKEPCKWRAKIRLLQDPDEMFSKPELMRMENFLVISNPKGHHHSYHCTQTHIDIDNLHKGRPKVTTTTAK